MTGSNSIFSLTDAYDRALRTLKQFAKRGIQINHRSASQYLDLLEKHPERFFECKPNNDDLAFLLFFSGLPNDTQLPRSVNDLAPMYSEQVQFKPSQPFAQSLSEGHYKELGVDWNTVNRSKVDAAFTNSYLLISLLAQALEYSKTTDYKACFEEVYQELCKTGNTMPVEKLLDALKSTVLGRHLSQRELIALISLSDNITYPSGELTLELLTGLSNRMIISALCSLLLSHVSSRSKYTIDLVLIQSLMIYLQSVYYNQPNSLSDLLNQKPEPHANPWTLEIFTLPANLQWILNVDLPEVDEWEDSSKLSQIQEVWNLRYAVHGMHEYTQLKAEDDGFKSELMNVDSRLIPALKAVYKYLLDFTVI